MKQTARPVLAVIAALSLFTVAACSDDAGGDSGSGGDDSGQLTVFAAASLTVPFGELEKTFEAEHDGIDVRLSFGGSSDLATQIDSGAPADVFASADTETMDSLGDLATEPSTFVSNTLEIATVPGNPEGIESFDDLANDDLDVVVCAAPVPCGSATGKMEKELGVTLDPVSEEQSVTDVLGKVETGEADAGVVYKTDVKAAEGKVDGVAFPGSDKVVNTYPISVLKDAGDPELAQEWVDFVLSPEGQKVLTDAGFGTP